MVGSGAVVKLVSITTEIASAEVELQACSRPTRARSKIEADLLYALKWSLPVFVDS